MHAKWMLLFQPASRHIIPMQMENIIWDMSPVLCSEKEFHGIY